MYLVDMLGNLTTLIDHTTTWPGSGGSSFVDFATPCFRDSVLIFRGFSNNSKPSIFTYELTGSSLTKIIDHQTAIPNGTGVFLNHTSPHSEGPITSIALCGAGSGGQIGEYLWDTSGNLSVIADINTPVPGGTGSFINFGFLLNFHENNAVFIGSGSADTGIYIWENGILETVADYNTAIPGGSGSFTGFDGVTVYDTNVAFIGYGANGQAGVYTYIEDTLAVVANTGTTVPGETFTFENFAYPPLLEGTQIYFLGYVGAPGTFGGTFTNISGTLQRVLATGDSLDNREILGAGFAQHGLSADGSYNHCLVVVFEDDGENAIYAVDAIVPPKAALESRNNSGSSLDLSDIEIKR